MGVALPPAPINDPDGFVWDQWFNQIKQLLNNVGLADVILGLTTTGIVVRTGTDTYTVRALTAPAAGFTITNNNGVSGAPVFVLANDLAALEGLGSTGIAVRSAADTWVQRTIVGTANQITVGDGSGAAGNPTLSLPVGNLASGTYTPDLFIVANIDNDPPTVTQCQYLRVGGVVTVSGKVTLNPTLTATSTQLGISLPIASNIGANEDLSGVAFASGIAGQGAAILGDATNDRAQLQFVSGDITAQAMYFTFTYQII